MRNRGNSLVIGCWHNGRVADYGLTSVVDVDSIPTASMPHMMLALNAADSNVKILV